MKDYLLKYWFFVALVATVTAAIYVPNLDTWLDTYHVLKAAIVAAFLVTGLTLRTRDIAAEAGNVRALAASVVSCFVFFPVVSFLAAEIVFGGTPDFVVGVAILGAVPVTVASGTILTGVARGNIPLSLLICVTNTAVAIFTIPFSLQLLLGFGEPIDLPVLKMIRSLILLVLLPILIGQLFRIKLRQQIDKRRTALSIFSQWVVLLLIANGVSNSADQISQAGGTLIVLVAFVLVLHGVILSMNYGISRLIRLDRPSRSAFTIHTSQKTLTVSYVVWHGYFTAYPMALIPVIVHHLTQVIVDMIVAYRFRDAADRDEIQT